MLNTFHPDSHCTLSLAQLDQRSEPICSVYREVDAHGRVHTYGASQLRCVLSVLRFIILVLFFVLHSADHMPSISHNMHVGQCMLLINRHQAQHWWGRVTYLGGSSLPGLLPSSWLLPGRLRLASILAILESGGHISCLLTGHM